MSDALERIKLDIKEWNAWRRQYTRPYAMRGELVDLRNADLSRLDLSGADLRFVLLDGANLQNTNLLRADLSEAKLGSAKLAGANLYESNLSFADMSNAQADESTNFAGANLHMTDFSACNLGNSSLNQAWKLEAKNLNKAKNINEEDLSAWLEHRRKTDVKVFTEMKPRQTVEVVDRARNDARKVLVVHSKELESAMSSLKDLLDSHVSVEDWTPDSNAKKIDLSSRDFNALMKLVSATNEWRIEEDAEEIVMLFLDRLLKKIQNIRPYSKKVGAIFKEVGGIGKDMAGLDGSFSKATELLTVIVRSFRSQSKRDEE